MNRQVFLFSTLPLLWTLSLGVPIHNELASTCSFPNNSDSSLHMYSCAASGDSIDVSDVTITDMSGNILYPIDPKQPFILNLKAFNKGVQIDDNHVAVKLFEYQKGWTSTDCAWSEVPSFGLLNNIDGCDFAKNCPLTVGDLTLQIKLDLSPFSSIINLLSKNVPIQLYIRMMNYNPGNSQHEEIACVVAQIRIN